MRISGLQSPHGTYIGTCRFRLVLQTSHFHRSGSLVKSTSLDQGRPLHSVAEGGPGTGADDEGSCQLSDLTLVADSVLCVCVQTRWIVR